MKPYVNDSVIIKGKVRKMLEEKESRNKNSMIKNLTMKAGDLIYRRRYLLAVLVLVMCVVLELSGSSVSMWADELHVPREDAGDMLGYSRLVRSDEWNVSTPFALSQYQSGFSYFSDIVRGDETDMYIVYGQPVSYYTVLFRPFHWGYLFLSPAKGLSFYWCSRFIVLLLVSFELGMCLFNRKKLLSLSYAVMMAAAPVVQWWFAINGLVEMLIYGQLAVVVAVLYMKDTKYLHRIAYGALLSVLATAYVLLFYPAWQVPFVYAFLFLLIGVVVRDYKKGTFTKKDWGVLGISVGLFAAELLPILWKSKDTIKAVLNTAYPGSRTETGGGMLRVMFNSLTCLWLPFEELAGNETVNECFFFSLFPLGIILAVYLLIKTKRERMSVRTGGKTGRKTDPVLVSLLLGIAFLGSYGIFGWPKVLSKVTLMSFSQSGREVIAFTWLNLLILMYAISRMEKVKPARFLLFSAAFSVGIVYVQNYIRDEYFTAQRVYIALILVFAMCASILLQANRKNTWLFFLLCTGVSAAAGMTVNPVHRGLTIIYENDLYKEIERIVDDESKDALWMVCNTNYSMGNFPIMAGARTINSTNVYPNLERWQSIDNDGENDEIYNRYAHIWAQTVSSDFDGDTFELVYADLFQLNITPEMMRELDVKYVLSGTQLESLSTDEITFENIYWWNGFYIYRLDY